MSHEHLLDYAVNGEPAKSLSGCVGVTQNLHYLAARYFDESEDNDRELTKEELSIRLPARVVKRLEEDFVWLNEDESKLINSTIGLMNQQAPLPDELETTGYLELYCKGYLYLFHWDKQLWFVVPIELHSVWARLCGDESLVDKQMQNREFLKYAHALVNLYGVCEIEQFVAVWNQHHKDKITSKIAQAFFERLDGEQIFFHLDDDLVVHYAIRDDDELDRLIDLSEGLPYYMPTKSVIEIYANHEQYEASRPEIENMKKFLSKTISDDVDDREALDLLIIMSCEQNWEDENVIALLMNFGLSPDDNNEEWMEFGKLYASLWETTRQWGLCGDIPANMRDPNRNISTRLAQYLHHTGQPRKTGKVGRNETCPCGSGKKYKKCCGRGH